MTALTMPDASVADEWQCTQPWVCTMLLMALFVPPDGETREPGRSFFRGSMLARLSRRNSTLFRLVKRRNPPQYLSARSAKSLIVCRANRSRGEPARTV